MTESQSQKAKQKKNPQAAAAQTSIIHHNSQHKHRKLKHENWNTTSQVRTAQAQFLLSMNLRFSDAAIDHKVTNILLGFEGKDKSKYLWLWTVKAEAKKLGWADQATSGGSGKWVLRGSHTLTDGSN